MRPARQSRYQTSSAIVATFVQHQGSPAAAVPAASFGQSANVTDDVIYAVHHSGTITRLAKGQLSEMSLGVRALCAEMFDDSSIVVGTASGLAVVNVSENAWWYATSYRGPVLHVCCFEGRIYASFQDGDSIPNHDGRERATAYTVVQIDGASYRAQREVPRLASNGIFDIDVQRRILQVPVLHGFSEQPGSFLYNFTIRNDGELTKQTPTQIHMEISGISEFKANAFISLEAGILYFIQTGKSIGFEGRINCFTALPDAVGYVFGLQNGQIVYMDEQLQGYVITNQSGSREVTAISQNAEFGRTVAVAYGNFQNIDDLRTQSELHLAHFTRNYTNGAIQLADF